MAPPATPPGGEPAGTGPGAREAIGVALGDRSYDIVVGTGLIDGAGRELSDLFGGRPGAGLTIVTDANVAPLYLTRLSAALDSAGLPHRAVTLDPGEHTKDFGHLANLLDDLLDGGLERGSLLVALGGGVIGDLTGFAAAVALRGIDFVQVPTTLLAQVDSSVGGKTGINTRHGKNLVGAFHQPRKVLADIGALDTLPRRELLAGYAEVVKYGLIGDAGFFAWLEANGRAVIDGDPVARTKAVAASCAAKARIVAADEREQGVRALLNLGHTFGHAMEAESGFSDALLHGEAVAIGMVLAFDLSERLGLCPAGAADRLRAHYRAVGLPDSPRERGFTAENLVRHMRHDKKVRAGRVAFILAREIGDAMVVPDVDLAEVERLLADRLGS